MVVAYLEHADWPGTCLRDSDGQQEHLVGSEILPWRIGSAAWPFFVAGRRVMR